MRFAAYSLRSLHAKYFSPRRDLQDVSDRSARVPAQPSIENVMPVQRLDPSNQLLVALPTSVRDRFLDDCTLVDLVLGSVLCDEGERMRYVYFPIDSFISVLKTIDGHSTLEVGMIGGEGMYGYAAILGQSHAPLRALTQGAGTAWRMKAAAFRRQLQDMPALRRLLHRYVEVLMRQLAQTAACTRFHVVEERLARWLLMTQDRAHADSFDVTQEFLAFMLGVRRVGVTTAAGVLQSRKLIRYKRGNMTILNRGRLEAAACTCYQSDLEIYRHGLAAVRKPQSYRQ
jgi:CRP-like cAMP-binding protein